MKVQDKRVRVEGKVEMKVNREGVEHEYKGCFKEREREKVKRQEKK